MNKQSGFIGLIIIVFIAIVAGIGGYVYYKHSITGDENSTHNSNYNTLPENQPSANSVSTTTKTKSTSFSTNTSTQYKTIKENKYSFEIPINWSALSGTVNNCEGVSVTRSIESRNGDNIQGQIDIIPKSCFSTNSVSDFKTEKDNYVITVAFFDEDFGPAEQKQETKAVYDHVVSSIKITP